MSSDREDELLERDLEAEGDLTDEILKRWDPDRLLRLVTRRAGKGQKLDLATRAKFEERLGVDLSGVKIYSGGFAEEIAKSHSAEALTIGTTGMILMGGSPDLSMATTSGQALLAHELTHVAQSTRNVHRRATFGESTPLATEEHEAEAEAAEAQEHSDAAGGTGQDAQEALDQEKRTLEAVRKRVLEMIAESRRVLEMRSGPRSWRP